MNAKLVKVVFFRLVTDETNLLRKNLLHRIVQDSLKRAEQIKEYVKVFEESFKFVLCHCD